MYIFPQGCAIFMDNSNTVKYLVPLCTFLPIKAQVMINIILKLLMREKKNYGYINECDLSNVL